MYTRRGPETHPCPPSPPVRGPVGEITPAGKLFSARPGRRVASLAVPWQLPHLRDAPRPKHIRLARASSPVSPPKPLVFQRRNRSHLDQRPRVPRRCLHVNDSLRQSYSRLCLSASTYCLNGATTRRKLLPVLLWNGLRPSTPVRC